MPSHPTDSPPAPRPRRRGAPGPLAAALATVAALAALALGPGVTLAGVEVGAGCAGAEDLPVSLVVDFGDLPGSPGHVDVGCVPTRSRMTGADALIEAGHQLRFDPSSGILCAIDGYPAEGCGQRVGEGRRYQFWSYWRADAGAAGWTYSAVGPAYSRPASGAVEGWRFVEGSASPSDPSPRIGPDGARARCAPAPTTTKLPGPGPGPTTPAGGGGSGGGSGGGGGGGGGPVPGQPTDPGTTPAAPAGQPGGAPAAPGTTPPEPGAPVPPDAATTDPAPDQLAAGLAAGTATVGAGGTGFDGPTEEAAIQLDQQAGEDGDTTRVWVMVAVLLAIAALGVGALVVARARPRADL